MSKSFSRILAQSKLLILAAVLAVGISYVSAAGSWTAPTAVPPGNNIDTPLNVGSNAQTKNGDLAVNAFLAALNAQFNGNVTVGNASSNAALVIPKNATVGDVLVSADASGTAQWLATSTLGLSSGPSGTTFLGAYAQASTTHARDSWNLYSKTIPTGATYAIVSFDGAVASSNDSDQSPSAGKIYMDLVNNTSTGSFVSTDDIAATAWEGVAFSSTTPININSTAANYNPVFPAYVYVSGGKVRLRLPSQGAAFFEFYK